MSARTLVVNADDFGRSAGVNAGVIAANTRGILTSASLMVRWPGAREAAERAEEHPGLSVGLHVDLGEWAHDGSDWHAVYEVVPTGDAAAVAGEVGRQLDAFRRLVGRDPTHLDSHQHVHLNDAPVRAALADAAAKLGVPLRGVSGGVRYCGAFYGQSGRGEPLHEQIAPERLAELIATLEPGVTEIACHPAAEVDFASPYGAERVLELRALCDPLVAAAVARGGVRLASFGTL